MDRNRTRQKKSKDLFISIRTHFIAVIKINWLRDNEEKTVFYITFCLELINKILNFTFNEPSRDILTDYPRMIVSRYTKKSKN